jgi:hypothetical protein
MAVVGLKPNPKRVFDQDITTTLGYHIALGIQDELFAPQNLNLVVVHNGKDHYVPTVLASESVLHQHFISNAVQLLDKAFVYLQRANNVGGSMSRNLKRDLHIALDNVQVTADGLRGYADRATDTTGLAEAIASIRVPVCRAPGTSAVTSVTPSGSQSISASSSASSQHAPGSVKSPISSQVPGDERDERVGFTCDICSRTFAKKFDLKEHMKVHSGQVFSCAPCGKEFTTSRSLKRHTLSLHEGKVHKCGHVYDDGSECQITRKHMAEIISHRFTAHKVGGLKCRKNCEKEFGSQKLLVQHEQRCVSGKDHACPECERKFTSLRGLKYHQASQHGKDPKFVCHICGKSLCNNHSLQQHLLGRHGQSSTAEAEVMDIDTQESSDEGDGGNNNNNGSCGGSDNSDREIVGTNQGSNDQSGQGEISSVVNTGPNESSKEQEMAQIVDETGNYMGTVRLQVPVVISSSDTDSQLDVIAVSDTSESMGSPPACPVPQLLVINVAKGSETQNPPSGGAD